EVLLHLVPVTPRRPDQGPGELTGAVESELHGGLRIRGPSSSDESRPFLCVRYANGIRDRWSEFAVIDWPWSYTASQNMSWWYGLVRQVVDQGVRLPCSVLLFVRAVCSFSWRRHRSSGSWPSPAWEPTHSRTCRPTTPSPPTSTGWLPRASPRAAIHPPTAVSVRMIS